jgi:hypothetical protein
MMRASVRPLSKSVNYCVARWPPMRWEVRLGSLGLVLVTQADFSSGALVKGSRQAEHDWGARV